jgi:exonuclease SbcD
MLKILHTADIHLGAKFSGLGSKGDSQREQLRATFKNVIATAINERVNIVLIAGDLFDAYAKTGFEKEYHPSKKGLSKPP